METYELSELKSVIDRLKECEISHEILQPLEKLYREYDTNAISIKWSIEDVFCVAPYLNSEQAYEILLELVKYHDADIGISWTNIDIALDDIRPDHIVETLPKSAWIAEFDSLSEEESRRLYVEKMQDVIECDECYIFDKCDAYATDGEEHYLRINDRINENWYRVSEPINSEE